MVLWRDDDSKLAFPFKKELNRQNIEEFLFMYETGKVEPKKEE